MSISCLCAATPNPTPFLFTVQDALTLDTSEGFQILREHLAATIKHDFCNNHRTSDAEDSQAWLVVRDVLHALLAPIVALEEHATRVAEAYVRSPRSEDLEFAYYGRGRNAFVWLQSFLSSDMDWCLSNGCPACIVEQALDAEFPVRMIIASCLLSDIDSDAEMDRPTLPTFQFFLQTLQEAMEDDDLWGPDSFEAMADKAMGLERAIHDLMKQTQNIELIMTPSPESPALGVGEGFSFFSASAKPSTPPGMPVKRSGFAEKQARMLREEQQWLKHNVRNCWQDVDQSSFAGPVTTEFVRRLSTVAIES